MAAPMIIKINVIKDPSANVEIPVTPCPIVQPKAKTPPIPIRIAPIMCLKNLA